MVNLTKLDSVSGLKVPKDLIIQLHDSGNWILYNVFTQNSVAVNHTVLKLLSLLSLGKSLKEIAKSIEVEELLVWDINIFSYLSSPLADPTRMIREYKDWPNPQKLNLLELILLLRNKYFLIENEDKYHKMLAPKKTFLDQEHLGNFHQQIGRKLVLEKRIDPSDWWVKQKFISDFSDLNNTLYKAVQGHFLKSFFAKRFNSFHDIVDIGCGVGYYTKLMGKNGAKVLGIDPNDNYIKTAEIEKVGKVSFKQSNIGSKGDLDWIPSHSMDFVFMSDALLFYFTPPNYINSSSLPKPDITILFSDIIRILKPGGSFISVEPNGIFLFRPWMGEVDRPFTIITEYNHPWYNVVPTYSQFIQAFIKGGFIIKDMIDVSVDEEFSKTDMRATNFAKEFPLWCCFELVPKISEP